MIIEDWDTANNREALAGKRPSRGYGDDDEHADGTVEKMPMGGEPEPPQNLENLVKSAYLQGVSYQQKVLQPKWKASYAAFNNQHFAGSKYLTPRYRGRTHLFRPKTRSAVRRKSAEAAAALFQTADVVEVAPGNDADPNQVASAAVNKELLNYRLTTAAENAGIPWFLISMGAHQTAQLCGVCISKQSWEYREKIVGEREVELFPGEMIVEPITQIVRDRPRVDLYPPEDVIRDPGANWLNQAQDSSYLILKNPMTLSDARQFLQQVDKDGQPMFEPVDEAVLAAAANVKSDDSGTSDAARRARETQGYDRYHDDNVDREFQTVWIHENFFRCEGTDWHFWTLGISKVISKVRPVEKVYPEQGGARPVTIGVGSLDAFKIDPMSPVEAWAPVQSEINDVVNLRLEVMKQTVSPVTKVRMGRNIDLKQVQNRSPDSVIYVQDKDDVEFDRPGSVGQEAFIEMERLNVDFDELAGTFSPGSVQANNQLNKTATGLSLISGSSNAMGEFDLRVWVETWVEDCLRQVMKLEQFYEADERVKAIAGEKAKLRQKFGIDEVTDALLTQQVTLRVNVGIGASDPMMRLQKLQAALMTTIQLMPTMQARLRQDPIFDEFMGIGGIKDASERFLYPGDDMDPRIQDMGGQIQQLEGQLQDQQAERDNKLEVARVNQVGQLAASHLEHRQNLEDKRADFMMQQAGVQQDQNFQREQKEGDRNFEREKGVKDRQFQREQGNAEHARNVDMEGKKAGFQNYMDDKQGARQETSERRQLVAKTAQGAAKPQAGGKANGSSGAADLRELLGLGTGNELAEFGQQMTGAMQQMQQEQAKKDDQLIQAIGKLAKSVDTRINAVADAIEALAQGRDPAKLRGPRKFRHVRGPDGMITETHEVN